MNGRSQNASIVTHVEGRLHNRALNILNWFPFYKRDFSWSEFFPQRTVPYGWKSLVSTFHLNVYNFNLRNGSYVYGVLIPGTCVFAYVVCGHRF